MTDHSFFHTRVYSTAWGGGVQLKTVIRILNEKPTTKVFVKSHSASTLH